MPIRYGVFLHSQEDLPCLMQSYADLSIKRLIFIRGSSTVNRGHLHHLAINANSTWERLPRCLGGDQAGGGI
jgi:hypothetical protein